MARPFSQLPGRLNRRSQKVGFSASQIVRQVAIGMGATLVDTTRVDTGVARSNWRATLGAPAGGTIPAYAPGNKLGIGETANAGSAKAQQKQVINRFNVKGHITGVFITNNVRYIEQLNNGRPGLAPGNMVEQAFQTGRIIAKLFRSGRKR